MSRVEKIQPNTNFLSQRWLVPNGSFITIGWMSLTVIVLYLGWINRDEGFISPETGMGYWLGIIGGCLMLLLLTYSLRKRFKAFGRILSIRAWFKFHMILGIVGPLFIIFHSNFHLGSVNSTVALVCMLLVSGSGIIGKYIYQRIHFGLYGEKIQLQQVLNDLKVLNTELSEMAVTQKQKKIVDILFESVDMLINKQSVMGTKQKTMSNKAIVRRISIASSKFLEEVDQYYAEHKNTAIPLQQIHNKLINYQAVLKSIVSRLPGLQLFEKLFSLWHVIHIPIFILMIITAVIHVVVVHMY